MSSWNFSLLAIISALLLPHTHCVELTFELEDNAKQCFYEEIKKNQTATLEYQVGFALSIFCTFLKCDFCGILGGHRRPI
jgi:emp24/gp25L/p24 family/GOLD